MRALILGLLAIPLVAQSPTPTIRSTTTEVRLDLVVRDKKARIVRDLKPEEIRVFEDGVPQTLRHFEFYEGKTGAIPAQDPSPAAPGSTAAASTQPSQSAPTVNDLRDVSIVSVMIGNLDPAGRKTTREALRDFLKNELRPNTYVGVYALVAPDYTLKGLARYDNDPDRISAAVERAVTAVKTETVYDSGFEPPKPLEPPPGAASETTTTQANAASVGPATTIARMMEVNWMTDYQDAYDRSARQLAAIRQLVRAQSELPGRKVMLIFMAGLDMHPETTEALYGSISAANRANVTIYAVDPAGYLASDLTKNRTLLGMATNASMRQQRSRVTGGDQTVRVGDVMAPELAAQSLQADPRGNLRTLAEATGGKLLANGSDLREPLRRAMEDVRTHYELTYAPTNSDYDAHFRKIDVHVLRPNVTLFAREGYFALPSIAGREVYPFEMATLKALNEKPLPHQFEFHTDALRFRPGQERSQYAYVFQVPMRNLSIEQDRESVTVHVSLTALVRDADGQIVERISKDIPYRFPASKAADLAVGDVTFSTPIHLAPGRYTIETAAIDRNSAKASVRRSVLVVGAAPSGLAMSDLALARRVDRLTQQQDPSDPFQARGGKIEPELSDTILTTCGEVRFYAVAYPSAPVEGPIQVIVELARSDGSVLRSPAQDAQPEPDGTVPVLISMPAAKLQPGQYNARLYFTYRGQSAARETMITVEAGDATGTGK